MKRDFELIYLIFNVLIETDDNHVTPKERIHEQLDSYSGACIDYHLALLSSQKWVEIFTDGVRMTWLGHDFYDAEFVEDDVEDKGPVEFKQS